MKSFLFTSKEDNDVIDLRFHPSGNRLATKKKEHRIWANCRLLIYAPSPHRMEEVIFFPPCHFAIIFSCVVVMTPSSRMKTFRLLWSWLWSSVSDSYRWFFFSLVGLPAVNPISEWESCKSCWQMLVFSICVHSNHLLWTSKFSQPISSQKEITWDVCCFLAPHTHTHSNWRHCVAHCLYINYGNEGSTQLLFLPTHHVRQFSSSTLATDSQQCLVLSGLPSITP